MLYPSELDAELLEPDVDKHHRITAYCNVVIDNMTDESIEALWDEIIGESRE